MQLDVEAVSRGDHKAIAEIQAVCRRIAQSVARKFQAHGFADDLAQELTIIVVSRLPQVYDGKSEIEPFVWEAARRLTLAHLRRSTREQTREDADDEESWQSRIPDEQSPTADAWAAGVIDAEQAKRAKEQLVTRIREKRGGGGERPTSRKGGDTSAWSAPSRRKRRRVWEVRRRLGWTQRQMAEALGVPLNRFRIAEQAADIPADWKRRGEELLARHQELPVGDGPDMVRRWTRLLGLGQEDVVGLARQIGVHRSTVFRWATGRSHPPGPVVLRVEAIILALLDVRNQRVKEVLNA